MIEVRSTRLHVEEMQRRLTAVQAEIYKETREGLEADWTAIAEGLDNITEAAAHASRWAWIVAGEES
jgi:hypothetical protein